MSAKGEKFVSKGGEGFQLYAGLGVVEEILAINPTNEQKAKIYGNEVDDSKEETVYEGKNDDGDAKLSLDVYFRIRGIEVPRKHRFFLEDKEIEVVEDDQPVKYKFVNQVGQVTTAESKEDLNDWFTDFKEWDDSKKEYVCTGEKKTFRKCRVGEDMLMRFLREALSLNYEKPSSSLDYNWKKIFAGNVKELLVDLQGDLFRKFVVMLQVTTAEKEDGIKHSEKLWMPNNNFAVPTLPEEAFKHINNGCKFPTGWLGKRWRKVNKQGEMIGGYLHTYENYPPTGYAPLEPIKAYNEENDVAAGVETKKPVAAGSEDDADY